MPICTQGVQRTWWPDAGTIIVTGPYWDTHYFRLSFTLLRIVPHILRGNANWNRIWCRKRRVVRWMEYDTSLSKAGIFFQYRPTSGIWEMSCHCIIIPHWHTPRECQCQTQNLIPKYRSPATAFNRDQEVNTRCYTPQTVWPRFWLQVNKAGTCPGSPCGSL